MSELPNPRPLDQLLAQAAWIGALARRLVNDDATADDLVQQTWMAALKHPPAEDRPLRPWLARVVHNFARQRSRNEDRRARRESEIAREESLPSTAELALRAQGQRDLVQAVLELPEPYRSTILLHYFEGMSLTDIARRSRIAANTVRTHHKRGLERLRIELDRRHCGDRAAWCALMLPLAHTATIGAATGMGALTKGALVMKPALKFAGAAIVLVLCAWTVERASSDGSNARADATSPDVRLEGDAVRRASAFGSGDDAAVDSMHSVSRSTDRSSLLRFRGRVLEMESGAPIEGCVLRLVSLAQRIDECASNVDGRFELPLPEVSEPSVMIVPPEGWSSSEPAYDVGDVAQEARREHVFHLSRIRRSRLSGVLVDNSSSDPVPQCYFELRQRGSRDILHSGEDGRFASDMEFESGPINVRAIEENPSSLRAGESLSFEHTVSSNADAEVRLPVLVGPSWKLELDGAPGLDPAACEAFLVNEHAQRWVAITTLHAGGPPWVRFPRWTLGIDAPWRVDVRSRDKLWAGSANVDTGPGFHPGVLVVAMSSCGSLTGKITGTDGEPVSQAKMWTTAVDAHSPAEHIGDDESGGNGRYVLGYLPPGMYELHVKSERFEEQRVTVKVLAGRENVCDVQLGNPLSMSPIRGILRSQSGRFDAEKMYVGLDNKAGIRVRWSPVMLEERGTSTIGSFAFEDVPSGEYVVRLPWRRFEWAPADAHVSPPVIDLEFTYLDLEPTVDLGLLVVDRETGTKVDSYGLEALYGDGSIGGMKSADAASALFKNMPRTRAFQFRVLADGYQPFSGTEASFRSPRGANPLRVELERGWGARFQVHDASWRPIAGARVALDGESVGTTDATGILHVRRGARPVRAEVEAAGMVCVSGDIDPTTGAMSEGPFMMIRVEMRAE